MEGGVEVVRRGLCTSEARVGEGGLGVFAKVGGQTSYTTVSSSMTE